MEFPTDPGKSRIEDTIGKSSIEKKEVVSYVDTEHSGLPPEHRPHPLDRVLVDSFSSISDSEINELTFYVPITVSFKDAAEMAEKIKSIRTLFPNSTLEKR
jgi:hypothetical protein